MSSVTKRLLAVIACLTAYALAVCYITANQPRDFDSALGALTWVAFVAVLAAALIGINP